MIGRLVDERYRILEAMAAGAMGSVYKAERVPVGKLVAIKFLHAAFATEPTFLTRFERETRAMSKLSHPNCVSVVDFGVLDGAPYLVMEYVAGTTLRDLIDDGPLPVARALALTRQIVAGLAHAHAQGIVHRDIKPANLMISDEIGTGDHVRILDFGLARLRGAVGPDATQSHVVVGTPNYMAPEQTVGGGTIDARTDVYAVGVVLFEMLTGKRPFFADDTLELFGLHRYAPIPRLADLAPEGTELPDGMQDVVDRALAKAPDDRYQSVIELSEAIAAITAATPSTERATTADPRDARPGGRRTPRPTELAATMVSSDGEPPVRPRPQRRMPWAAVTIAAAAIVGGGVWYAMSRAPGERDAPLVVRGADAASATTIAVAAPIADAAVVSPDRGDVDATPGAGAIAVDAAAAPAADTADAADAAGELEMDPMTAADPDPAAATAGSGSSADDEAADAPATTAELDTRTAVATPALATNLHDAIELARAGKHDLALASMRALWKKSPTNADLPFLLGNLYYDQRWWSVAMEHYRDAIRRNGGYKRNPTLTRNVIRMLASPKTRAAAATFLRSTIGSPAAPYLRAAAQHEPNPIVRKQAAALAKQIR